MASQSANGSDCPVAGTSSDGHEEQRARISRPSMYMVMALWMERSPLTEYPNEDETDPHCKAKKVGAVFVLPHDRVLTSDCSQGGVHGAVIALNKFGQERVKGCQVYMSRRPCSFCTKLLVQSGISKVYYLPTEPEISDPQDIKVVDHLFINASSGLSPFVPEVDMTVINEMQQSPYSPNRNEDAVKLFTAQLKEDHWSDEWIRRASEMHELPFFDDQGIKAKMMKNMTNLFEWIARTTLGDVPDNIEFAKIDDTFSGEEVKSPTQQGPEPVQPPSAWRPEIPSIPTPGEDSWQQLALHMSRMAQMLSQRSDDPIRGVGCVLMLNNEVVATNWNGFPSKALYGEFPRSTHKKPYVIHAEQNSLLTKNTQDLNPNELLNVATSVLYVSKVPCHECVPSLIRAGVKHFVFPKINESEENGDNHRVLKRMLQQKKCACYTSKEKPQPPSAQAQKAAKKIDFDE